MLSSRIGSQLDNERRVSNERAEPATILVIGGDSTIGSCLYQEAKMRGLDVYRTSRRDSRSGETWHLSLGDKSSTSSLVKAAQARGVTDAVMALGETSIASCAADPSAAWKINVTYSQELVSALTNIGINVMVLSSASVFSGRTQFPTERDACDPETEYGRQKAALEESSLDFLGTSILRITKVLSPRARLWSQWFQAIREGDRIQAFGNVKFSPLRISNVVGSILSQIESPAGRIVHLSPPDAVTYSAAVQLMAEEMGIEVKLEPLNAHRDANRGILPDKWTTLGTIHRDSFLQTESSESAMRIFTRQVVGWPT